MIVKGLFDVTELNMCCVALPNTVPQAINSKYYEFSYRSESRRWGEKTCILK